MTFSHLLLLTGAVVTPYYKLDNVLEAYSEYYFDISYSAPKAHDCTPTAGILQIPFHPDPSVRMHQCFQKCKSDPDDPGCLATDTGGSNVVCLDLAGMKELCTGLGECYGFERLTSSRFLMYTYACQGKMNPAGSADFYYKEIAEPPECALGVGVHVAGGKYPMAEGLYEQDGMWPDTETSLFYTQVDGPMVSTISWHNSGCGWVLSTDLTVGQPPPPEPEAGPACFDDNEAANFAFGHMGDDAIPDICSVAKESWGQGSYCSNSIFAAMCPVSCNKPCTFSLSAARDYMTMIGKPIKATVQKPCATVPALACGTSPVTDAICRSTCGRRLTAADTAGLEVEFDVELFRRSMADMHLAALGQRLTESGASEQNTHRRLFRGLQAEMTEVYWSFDSLTCANPSQSPDKMKLQGAMMYDVLQHVEPVMTSATLTCPEETKYAVTGIGKYCKHGNVDTPYNDHPAVVNNNCYRKCTLMKPQPTTSIDNGTVVVSGPYPPITWSNGGSSMESDWCAGNDAEFTPDTNALCLPREDCEALCEKLGPACHSIDMHRKFPRCYLNAPGTCMGVDSAEYDVLTKVTPPEVIAVVDDTSKRVSWNTVTGKSVMEIDQLSARQGERSECESVCAANKECLGFVFESGCMFTDDGKLTSSTCGDVGRCFMFYSAVTLTPYLEQYVDDITEVIPMLDYSVVFKEAPAPCTSLVSHAGMFDGLYIYSDGCPSSGGSGGSLECATATGITVKGVPAGTFLKPDNTTRVRFGEYECDGWVLEKSLKATVTNTLYNCSDFPGPVNLYFSSITGPSPWMKSDLPIPLLRMIAAGKPLPMPDGNETMDNETMAYLASIQNLSMVDEKEFPCQWGADSGYCTEDAVFAAICQHTCTPLLMTLLADEMYAYQSEIAPSMAGSPCGQDNDAAMVSFASVFYPMLLESGDTCAAMMTGDFYNSTHSPCHLLPLSPVIEILCWATCQSTELIVTTTTPEPIYDEGSLKGSVDRRLQGGYAGMSYFARKWQPMTVSYGGSDDGITTVSYICGVGCGSRCARESCAERWEVHYMSFPKRGACPAIATSGTARYLELPKASFYAAAMPVVEPPVDVKLVCRTPKACPELTTCVLTANRFADELASFRMPGLVARSEWLSSLDTESLATVMGEFVPKTIISDSRADAMIAGSKAMAEFISLVYRSVPGGSMVRLPPARKYRQYADKTFVTLAPPRYNAAFNPLPAGMSPPVSGLTWSQVELGRKYSIPTPKFWKGGTFMTDVIRIERFQDEWLAEHGTMHYPPATMGSFTFDLYAPGVKDLTMLVYPMMVDTPMLLEDFGGSVQKVVGPGETSTGWFQVTLPSVAVDVVGIEDLDECAMKLDDCDPNAVCSNFIGKGFDCACIEGFSGDGHTSGSGCLLEPEVYDSASQDYYFRLKHNDRMDYGWRVKELYMYTDPACTQPYAYSGPVKVPGNYPRTGGTNKGPANLFDGRIVSEWWSESLTLNPEIVDGTHGGSVVLEWQVPGDVVIECVEILQNGQHMSKDLTLTRGPTKGPDCSMDGELCEPTMMWHVQPKGEKASFETRCGVANTQFFGEILVLPHTTGAGWIGNFAEIEGQADPVPSACHCMALCIQYIKEGCRSYKYYDSGGVKHCYLQSNLFSPGEGYWGTPGTAGGPGPATRPAGGLGMPGQWPGWRSGTPAESRPRLLGFTPMKVEAGVPFTLEISAVGLPYDPDENYNTAPRQRVKIMEADKDCKEKPPMEVSGIGCTETLRKVVTGKGTREEVVYTICSPRPMYADSETLSFGPISISASSEGKEYKVCYCAGQCYEPSSYRVVPGRLKFPKSTFIWEVDPPMVYRKEVSGEAAMLTVSVTRPVFGSFSDPNNWEMKIVRDYFGCGVVGDTSKFKCTTGVMAEPDLGDKQAPKIMWDHSYPAPMANETDIIASVIDDMAAWQLVMDEPVTTVGCMGSFYLKASGVTKTLPCSQAMTGDTLLYLYFGEMPAGAVGLEWDTGAVMDLNGNPLAGGNTTGIGLFKAGSDDSTPEILVAMPKNGGQNVLTGSNITLYTAVGGLGKVANLTFIDCGDDGVCGTKDDGYFMESDYHVSASGAKITIRPLKVLLPGNRYQVYFEPGSVSGGNVKPYTYQFMAECPLPSYLSSQDQASWVFEMDLDVADAGQYAICFREKGGMPFGPIPGELSNFMTVHKIAADRTHPRGIFHNQQFSALTGSAKPLSITVSGTRVPTPTDSKIAITKGKVCGAAKGFSGVPVRKLRSEDVSQPLPIIEDFLPKASGGVAFASTQQAFVLKFTEPVTTAGCRGNFSFIPTDTTLGPTKAYSCELALASKDTVIFQNTGLFLDSGVTYFMRVDTGAVKDLAGNEMTILNTKGAYEITVEDDETGPFVAHTFPCADCTSDLWYMDYETGMWSWGHIILYLSEAYAAADGDYYIKLTDCGMDYVCDEKDHAVDYFLVSQVSTIYDGEWNRLYIPVYNITEFRRYQVTVPGNAFKELNSDPTGPGGAQVFEFEYEPTAFSYNDMVISASSDSETSGLVYDLGLWMNMDPSAEYSICYCDEQKDGTLEDLGDDDTTYKLYDDKKCVETTYPVDVEEVMVAGLPLEAHQCEAKCAMGCTGPFCFCSGYDATATDETLCLSPALCREACDASSDCVGINIADELPQCILIPAVSGECINGTAAKSVEDWQMYEKKPFTACTHLSDFSEKAGSLFVTSRVEVAVDYVLEPGKDGSIELTAPEGMASLTYEHPRVGDFTAGSLLSGDRITIIDCKGTCGVSSPTTALLQPPMADKISTWNDLYPYSWFVDKPHNDMSNPEGDTLTYAKSDGAKMYTTHDGVYCSEGNIDLEEAMVPFDGIERKIKEHQCYTKCSKNAPCMGDDCFCSGLYSSYDGPESNALCADVQLCQYMCDQIEGCTSIDMHKDIDRCFLNMACDMQKGLLPDPNYMLLIKNKEANDEQAGTSSAVGGGRRLLPGKEQGFSWNKMLRFKPVEFKSGGTFKLCFCDSTILGPGEVCSTEKDYKIEVGTIHASGVSCLIKNPKLQRVSCEDQYHGGWRCYEHMEAPRPPPPVVGVTPLPVHDFVADLDINTLCRFMPEEEAKADPRCQTVAGFQSTDPLRK